MRSPDTRMGFLCLGASAGGLRSLELVLSNLPPTFPWPVLVSQHMQPDHVSLLPEILGRATRLPVREAADGDTPEPGVVYTCPSNSELGVSPEGRLTIRPPPLGPPQRIDHLFSTASFARPGLVVAVVLSGTGTDGTAGALVVKLNGGTVIAESDETAQHTGMPRAAAKAGTVDTTRPAGAIASLVVALAEGGLEEATKQKAGEIMDISKTLTQAFGTDFSRYRAATVRRRVEKRRAILGIASNVEYHALLKRDAAERDVLMKSLLLPVTEFFRDPPAWDALKDEVLPELAARAREGATIRVWCAGCATGEEAYTMAIALAESGAPLEHVQIVGTDLDASSISLASFGVYDPRHMRNVDENRLARHFVAAGEGFRVDDELRRAVEFRVQDLTRDPAPDGQFDIIVCRNVLIYFDESLQSQMLATFEDSLVPGGVLFLGRSTALPAAPHTFEPVARTMRIFRSRRNADAGARPAAEPTRAKKPAKGDPHIDAVLIQDSSAMILVVDRAWRVTFANRRAREATSEDVVGKSLLDAIPRWQGSPVHDALRGTLATGRSVRIQGAPMGAGFADIMVDTLAEAGEPRLIIVAHPSRAPHLRARREYQETLRDDLTETNDELQTANEELAAANEELQATNEELSSLNEEFLSTNQNLASTNATMEETAAEAQPAADLLHAILETRGDASIACDASRRVTMVTPRAAALLGIDGDALGKPLDVRAMGVSQSTLEEWLEAAARSRTPIHRSLPAHARRVTVEAVASANGARLGWLLTWIEVPPPQTEERQGN